MDPATVASHTLVVMKTIRLHIAAVYIANGPTTETGEEDSFGHSRIEIPNPAYAFLLL
jgi:hypothetical protein